MNYPMHSKQIPTGKPRYATEEEAFRRVEQLQEVGMWPGVWFDSIDYRLTCDPVWPEQIRYWEKG